MRPTVLPNRLPALGALTDRQINRALLGIGAALVLLIAGFAAFYLIDQGHPTSVSLAERRIPQLEEAVRQDPNSIDLRLRLVGAYGAANRYSDAIAQLDAVLTASPNNKTALVNRGDFELTIGSLDAAASDYGQVIAIAQGGEFANVDTELQQAYYGLGVTLIKQGKQSEAIAPLKGALVINRTDADTLNLLGEAYLGSGDAKSAIDPLRTAILFVPADWADPYTSLAKAYRALGQTEEASWADAMAAFAGGDATSAKSSLMALISGTAATDAYVGLGLVNERLGDRPAALAAYENALRRDPKNFAAEMGQSRLTGAPATPASPIGSPIPSSGALDPKNGVPHA